MSSATMSSPFASQLGTNYCPPDAELPQIEALLVEPRLKLQSLDEEIAVLRQALDQLAEERDNLSTYVEAHQALLSPVRRLPIDIIGAIFMACLPTHRNCAMSAQEAPVLLGRICSSWRAISLEMPQLWSRLHIVEPTPSKFVSSEDYSAKVAQRLEVAHTWLRRSGTCPLSISLESKLDPGASPFMGSATVIQPYAPSPALNALLPFASRWQYIDLVIPSSQHQALAHLTEDNVPRLAHLRVFHRHEATDISSLTQLGILHAPNLTSFSVVGGKMNTLHLPLRWDQLTALSFDGTFGIGAAQAPETILTILSRCPHLRTVHFLIRDFEESQLQPVYFFTPASVESHLSDTIVECSFLHTIYIHCVGNPPDTSGRLLRRLWLPELRDFTLRGYRHHQAPTTESVDLLLSSLANSTHLESISIDSAIFSKVVLIHFLLGLPPLLLRLEIAEPLPLAGRPRFPGHVPLDDSVMEVLDASFEGPTPCPALEELVITACRTVSDKALLSFVRSRLPTLKHVRVAFDRERQMDILAELQHSTEAGDLKISLTYVTFPAPSFSPWEGLPDGPPDRRLYA
ncbi:hypothetical protein C8R45DRAFT_979681 [Mycena sanguinolenta]|nr:hypothetical protein C8R45DRAFT_979681 [Mycena sanguinolenta]